MVPKQTDEVAKEARGGNGDGEAETGRSGRERRRGSAEQRGEATEAGTCRPLRPTHLAGATNPVLPYKYINISLYYILKKEDTLHCTFMYYGVLCCIISMK